MNEIGRASSHATRPNTKSGRGDIAAHTRSTTRTAAESADAAEAAVTADDAGVGRVTDCA